MMLIAKLKTRGLELGSKFDVNVNKRPMHRRKRLLFKSTTKFNPSLAQKACIQVCCSQYLKCL